MSFSLFCIIVLFLILIKKSSIFFLIIIYNIRYIPKNRRIHV
ncbi:hypothetical protein CHISP_1815 [Chitinispirillum alkaliphilum]|nr:hypothetical protein CHISP_1815 [Chitinispirillum alkaliphilum]